MTTYAAFLRGIMPSNPNMSNANLRSVFEKLGFKNVQTVISSGNVIFSTQDTDIEALEKTIEAALTKKLGISSAVIIRSKDELSSLFKKDPFKGKTHGRETYLIVTFMKEKPYQVFNSVNLEQSKTPDFMRDVEKKYGKVITTRTWKTIERILAKMAD